MTSLRLPPVDPTGDIVKARFISFLQGYVANVSNIDELTVQQRYLSCA